MHRILAAAIALTGAACETTGGVTHNAPEGVLFPQPWQGEPLRFLSPPQEPEPQSRLYLRPASPIPPWQRAVQNRAD